MSTNNNEKRKSSNKPLVMIIVLILIALLVFVAFKLVGDNPEGTNENNNIINSGNYISSIDSVTGTLEEAILNELNPDENIKWADNNLPLKFTSYRYDDDKFIGTGYIENTSDNDLRLFIYSNVEIKYEYLPDMLSDEWESGYIITSCNFILPDNFMIKSGQKVSGIDFIFPKEAVTTYDLPESALDVDGTGPSYCYSRVALIVE